MLQPWFWLLYDAGTVQFFYGDLICFSLPFHSVNRGMDMGSHVLRHGKEIVSQPDWKKKKEKENMFPAIIWEIYDQIEVVGSPMVVRSGLPTLVFAFLLDSSHGDCG